GKKVGLAINPPTSIGLVEPYLSKIDELLVMTVNPGFGGQAFIPETLEKIRVVRKLAPQLDISVDGGINPVTARQCVEAGANILVAGNSLFRHKTLALPAAVQELRAYVEN